MKRVNVKIGKEMAGDMEALRAITAKTNEQLITEAWRCYVGTGEPLHAELRQLIPVFFKHRVQAREADDGDEDYEVS
jgi:hypothetical protein